MYEEIKNLTDQLLQENSQKKSIELEFLVIKKNFIELRKKFENSETKNEELGIQLINLKNQCKAYEMELQKNINNI